MKDWRFLYHKYLHNRRTTGGLRWTYLPFMSLDHEREMEKYILWGGSDTSFVDVGACTGRWSLFASRIYKQVLAFEPSEYFKVLNRNIRINNLNNIKTFNIALGSMATEGYGLLQSKLQDDTLLGHHYIAKSKIGNHIDWKLSGMFTKVQISTLDKQDWSIQPSMIKIDTEGFEVEVIKGGLSTIQSYHPHLIIEIHDEANISKIKEILFWYDLVRINWRTQPFLISKELLH